MTYHRISKSNAAHTDQYLGRAIDSMKEGGLSEAHYRNVERPSGGPYQPQTRRNVLMCPRRGLEAVHRLIMQTGGLEFLMRLVVYL
jgi:hypothetical protein